MKDRALLNICFDNSRRLTKKTHYFEYHEVPFKLVQDNPRKRADHLLTIITDESTRERAFKAAAAFLSALAWENDSRVALWEVGSLGWPEPHSLRDARPNFFTFPRISFDGCIMGYGISRLPHVETEDQRVALALFREARASNNDYLSFLFHWQVLEVGGGEPVGFINKTFRRNRSSLRLMDDDVSNLPLNGRNLGNYLLDDCRDAIAHLRRKPGRTNLDVDRPADRLRLTRSVRVIEAFAKHYIREKLGLKKIVVLAHRKHGDIPAYFDSTIYIKGHLVVRNAVLRLKDAT